MDGKLLRSNQPAALHLLNFVSMWECFSYYGMRALLVLFLIDVYQYSDAAAFGLYALYATLVDLCGVFGGIVADRYLGLKRAITLGGWTIAIGHLCLALLDISWVFYLGLGFIVVGTGLFRSNAAMFLGEYYEEHDPRREAGYTLYYTGICGGAFLASIFCGIVGEVYGWHAGFSLAAIGMLSGNVALLFGRKILQGKGQAKIERPAWHGILRIAGILGATGLVALAIYSYDYVSPWVPLIVFIGVAYILRKARSFTRSEKHGLYRLVLYVGFLIVFFSFEEQLGSSLIVFAERHVDRDSWFGSIPASSLMMFNTLTLLIAGPVLSRFVRYFPMHKINMIGLSFCFLGLSFGILYLGCHVAKFDMIVPLGYLIFGFVVLAIAELLIGPTIYAYASEIAPKNYQGLIMSIVAVGFSMANLLGGWVSKLMAVVDGVDSFSIYSSGFGFIGLFTAFIGIILMSIKNHRRLLDVRGLLARSAMII